MFYTRYQFQVFAEDLARAFLDSGFEVVQEPYIDYDLHGFRATYIRRYVLEDQTNFYDGFLTTLIQVVGLPFGYRGNKMIVISTPKSVKGEQVAESVKLRLYFDTANQCFVVTGNHPSQPQESTPDPSAYTKSESQQSTLQPAAYMRYLFVTQTTQHGQRNLTEQKLEQDLMYYVKHLIQIISPGLIQLPTEIKLEILKKLSVLSVVKMSQVNNEFRSLIFHHGETLWRHLCWRDFNITNINRQIYRSWLELYRDSYIIHQIEIIRRERALPGLPERPALPPAPYRLQIEWFERVLELPFYDFDAAPQQDGNQVQLAVEMVPLQRADSLDSIA